MANIFNISFESESSSPLPGWTRSPFQGWSISHHPKWSLMSVTGAAFFAQLWGYTLSKLRFRQ
jgi:hypothetical protein